MTVSMLLPTKKLPSEENCTIGGSGSNRMQNDKAQYGSESLDHSNKISSVDYNDSADNPATDGGSDNDNSNPTLRIECRSGSESDDSGEKVEIDIPRKHDCILGRGGFANNHIGNVNFRKLVNQHKMRYLSCNKIDKPKVAREVVRIWREYDPPGRFLQKKEGLLKGAPPVWIETSNKKAQEKASQCLRERTADVLPYLSKLQEHRTQMREKGVSMISKQISGDSLEESLATEVASDPASPSRRRNSMHPSILSPFECHSSTGNHSTNRRLSMPAGRSSATPITPTSHHGAGAARRTSMPASNHLQGSHPHHQPQHHNMMMIMEHHQQNYMMLPLDMQQQHQRVLQEAYTAIEQSGGVDPHTNMMFMERMRQEQEMMQREAMMRHRHQQAAMMQHHQHSPMMHGSLIGSGMRNTPNPQVPRSCDSMMLEQQKMILEAAQKREQALHENMKESLIDSHRAQVMQEQEAGGDRTGKGSKDKSDSDSENAGNLRSDADLLSPRDVLSGHELAQRTSKSSFDIEPIPFDLTDDDVEIDISIIPDIATSTAQINQGLIATSALDPREEKEEEDRVTASEVTVSGAATETTAENSGNPSQSNAAIPDWKRRSDEAMNRFSPINTPQVHPHLENHNSLDEPDIFVPLKDPPPSAVAPRKLKSAFKKSYQGSDINAAGVVAASRRLSGDTVEKEYRKTLEDYMTNHQLATMSAGAVDIDDDISETDVDISGLDASAWIQQALHDSGETSMEKTKKKKKRKDHQFDHHGQLLHQEQEQEQQTHDHSDCHTTASQKDFMSTDGRSMDGTCTLDNMSIMSLAISEMGKSMDQSAVLSAIKGDAESYMEEETIKFEPGRRMSNEGRRLSSNQSVMSELTDFLLSDDDGDDSDDDDSDDEDDNEDLVI